MDKSAWIGVAVASMAVSWTAAVKAEGAGCAAAITRRTVVPCALAASLAVRAERDELDAARARHLTVSPLLPSNPTVSVSGSRRSLPGQRATNWSASLSQELEIAGQRGLRRDSAEAAMKAGKERVLAAQRRTAAEALLAYFRVLAAREEAALSERLLTATAAVATAARARSDRGLIAPIDADVADAITLRVLRNKLAAEREVSASRAALTTFLGLDPLGGPIAIDGDLTPLPAELGAPADDARRPELAALEGDRRSLSLQADAFRRSRVPNPTVSAFVQNDGFDERVLGLGLSLPIPIPGNVGRTFNGEIAESEALSRRAATEKERTRRGLRLDVAIARAALEAKHAEVGAYTPELIARSDTSLRALGQEVENGRLTVREAVIAQQALIELLLGYVEARRDLCIASVELALAAGAPLERGTP